jgi:hypothetical protein
MFRLSARREAIAFDGRRSSALSFRTVITEQPTGGKLLYAAWIVVLIALWFVGIALSAG